MKFILFVLLITLPCLAKNTAKEIEKTFGFIPSFLQNYPVTSLPFAWDEMKKLEFKKSALSPKMKELISLTMASQNSNEALYYFSTKLARLRGAKPKEMSEALAVAAQTQKWSSIFIGMQLDQATFRREVNSMLEYARDEMRRVHTDIQAQEAHLEVINSKTAYEDVRLTYGLVPGYMKKVPEKFIADAWLSFKSIAFNPYFSLSGANRELIAIAVSTQIPCEYSVYLHTEAARIYGASNAEIAEAVSIGGYARQLGMILNTSNQELSKFKKEIDRIIKYMSLHKKL